MMHYYSFPQCVGYVAFILGVTAFLQKNDRRLKVFVAGESFAYVAHFVLLGNFPASASAFVSGTRSLLSLKSRSPYLAGAIVAVNLGFGIVLAKTPLGWLPVIASSVGTLAVFLMQGIPMRVALFVATLLWLANNIISGSIGGTLLELVIATVNIWTMTRLFIAREKIPPACPQPVSLEDIF